jgi:hypothetical protein
MKATAPIITLTEAASTSETSVVYPTTRRKIPEGSHLNPPEIWPHEKPKSRGDSIIKPDFKE